MIKPEAISDYINRYRHKASILAIIHSRLANKNSNWDLAHTCTIVILTGVITFLGFIGTDRILNALGTVESSVGAGAAAIASSTAATNVQIAQEINGAEVPAFASKATFDFGFNLVVLLLFVASLLNLIFRWKERYTAHFSGVVKLRQFIGWLDELALGVSMIDAGKLKHIRHKYESIVELLPPNSDKDYEKAKSSMKTFLAKASQQGTTQSQNTFDDEQFVIKIVRDSIATMEVLRAASRCSVQLWLGGGSVRTLAWNYLTGRSEKVHDYDIIYFDQKNIDEVAEKRIEAELKAQLPRAIRISVKNQARMHVVNKEPKRSSLEDAIATWPERATATAMRLDSDGKIFTIAPYGFEDVLDLVVQPTPYHAENPTAFRRRVLEKDWKKNWPELEIRESQ